MDKAIEKKGKAVYKAGRGNPIIDVGRALKMRLDKGMTYEEIAKCFGVSVGAVKQRLIPFKRYLDDPEAVRAFDKSKSSLLTVVEQELVSRLLVPATLQKASLNNLAYTLQNVHNINRLEQGKSTSNLSVQSTVARYEQELERLISEQNVDNSPVQADAQDLHSVSD